MQLRLTNEHGALKISLLLNIIFIDYRMPVYIICTKIYIRKTLCNSAQARVFRQTVVSSFILQKNNAFRILDDIPIMSHNRPLVSERQKPESKLVV